MLCWGGDGAFILKLFVGICDDLITVPRLYAFSIAFCCALVIAYIRLQGRDLERDLECDLLLGIGVPLLWGLDHDLERDLNLERDFDPDRGLERDLGLLISISVYSY